jgi:hypothetical protein
MFEEEARIYRSRNTNYYEWDAFCADDGEAIEVAYQKGATDGYNKANEWHYVKDGDLPNPDFYRVDVTVAYLNAYKNPCKMDCCFDGMNFVYWDDKCVKWFKVNEIKGKVYAWKYQEKLPEIPEDSE